MVTLYIVQCATEFSAIFILIFYAIYTKFTVMLFCAINFVDFFMKFYGTKKGEDKKNLLVVIFSHFNTQFSGTFLELCTLNLYCQLAQFIKASLSKCLRALLFFSLFLYSLNPNLPNPNICSLGDTSHNI